MHFWTPLDEGSSKQVFFWIILFLFLSNTTFYVQKKPNLGQNFPKSVNYPPPLLRSGEYVHKYLTRRWDLRYTLIIKCLKLSDPWESNNFGKLTHEPFFPYGDMAGGVWVQYLMFSYRKIGAKYILFISKIPLYSIILSWTIKTWK